MLLKPSGAPVPCTFCFSIRRDIMDLPSLVIGASACLLSPCPMENGVLTPDGAYRTMAAVIITRSAHPLRPPQSSHTYPALSTLPAVAANAEVPASYPLYTLPHFALYPATTRLPPRTLLYIYRYVLLFLAVPRRAHGRAACFRSRLSGLTVEYRNEFRTLSTCRMLHADVERAARSRIEDAASRAAHARVPSGRVLHVL